MVKPYDFLIVGSGLFGAVFANRLKSVGKKCLIVERRAHVGGNIYCENIEGINVHKYGPHIFHTNDKTVWNFVNNFVEFNRFTYSPLASFNGKYYNLPFNMNTFYQLWGLVNPEEVRLKIKSETEKFNIKKPRNLEEQALSLVGADIYNTLIKGYTEKQWGRACTDLPPFIIKRLPLRYTFDNNYFNDKYQGIPIGGYNKLIDSLLNDIEVKINVNYGHGRHDLNDLATKVVYTGMIDELYGYKFGALEYRSLEFETQVLDSENYQGVAAVNYTSKKLPYTRIVEHKHFEFGRQKSTVITKEYPKQWTKGQEPYYPINDVNNQKIYNMYKELAIKDELILGGRLAEYKYYDMHQVIAAALKTAENEIKYLDR